VSGRLAALANTVPAQFRPAIFAMAVRVCQRGF
jgi:hypothetical protein